MSILDLLKPKEQKQQITIIKKVLAGSEYVVNDLSNREHRVYSIDKYNKGDTVVIQGTLILGRGKFDTNIKSFEV